MSKFCINCVHYTRMGSATGSFCTRRIVVNKEISAITGIMDKVLKSGKYSLCEFERAKASTFFTERCGPSGQFFEEGKSKITGIELANSNLGGVYV